MAELPENFTLDGLVLAIKMISERREEDKEKFKEAESFLKKVERSKLIWVRSHELLILDNLNSAVRLSFSPYMKEHT